MYFLEWKENALRNLDKLETSISKRIAKKIEEMSQNPFLHDVKKLKGYSNLYRLRIGDYRIIFELVNNLITILKIGHRQQIYD